MTLRAIGLLLLTAFTVRGETPTIAIDIPMAPPAWALMERALLDANSRAVEQFARKYIDGRGYLLHTPRWGTLDGPDDAIETYYNWTLLHALGASQSVLDLYRKGLEGRLAQYGELRTELTELARHGAYRREFITQSDWFHTGEGMRGFLLYGLSDPADPADPVFVRRMKRFAEMYMGHDRLAPNYDPDKKIIKSIWTGSRGPMLRKATTYDWVGDPVPGGLRSRGGRGDGQACSRSRRPHGTFHEALPLAVAPGRRGNQEASMLIDSPKGNFKFLEGIEPFSSGAVASAGYEVVHAIFHPLPGLWNAFDLIEKRLRSAGRPLQALCGMELRIPEALSVEGFDELNQPYIDRLKEWDTHVDGLNPVARTNVALELNPVAEPAVYGFCYTMPSDFDGRTCVIAGSGETQGALTAADGIVSRGDVSAAGMRAKTEQTLLRMTERLERMGLGWSDIAQSNIYTVHNIHQLMASTILPSLHEAGRHGIRWHFARPPVLEIEFEMDMRGVRQEIVVSGESA